MHFHSDNSHYYLTYYSFRKIRLTDTNHLHLIDLGNSDSVCFRGRGVEFLKAIEVKGEHKVYIQGEHKFFPLLQTFITRKLRGIQTYFFLLVTLRMVRVI